MCIAFRRRATESLMSTLSYPIPLQPGQTSLYLGNYCDALPCAESYVTGRTIHGTCGFQRGFAVSLAAVAVNAPRIMTRSRKREQEASE